jgi:hypothetical protein
MGKYSEKSLPKAISKALEGGGIESEDLGLLLTGISNSKRTMRSVVTLLHESSHLWEEGGATSNRALRAVFIRFMEAHGVDITSSEMTRILQASEVEKIAGIPIGTCKESALRSLSAFLVKGKEHYISEVLDEALRIAGKGGKSIDIADIRAKHVDKALSGEKFKGIIKKRGRKPSSVKGNKGSDSLPIGNEKNKKNPRLIEELVCLASKLSSGNVRRLITRAKKYAGEDEVDQ